jgi:hypothetical protein
MRSSRAVSIFVFGINFALKLKSNSPCRNHMYSVTSFYVSRMAAELVFDFFVSLFFVVISLWNVRASLFMKQSAWAFLPHPP